MPRIYLDNAATSWPKPEAVYRAVEDWQRRVGAAYGRGASPAGDESRAVVDRARRGVARLLGESDPRRVVFTTSGTDSLNTALLGLLKPGDHVVSTVVEHNAVSRPLRWLASPDRAHPIEVDWVDCDHEGLLDADRVVAAMRSDTRLVAVIQGSNVTGAVQPVEAIAAEARRRGARVLVDAAQTLGRWPIDVRRLGADLIASPGHKGLLGPLGTGVLWLAPGLEREVDPARHGGAASGGDLPTLPTTLPDRFEAGNLNVPGLAGLAAGVEHVLNTGVDSVRATLAAHRVRLAEGLRAIDGVEVFGPERPDRQAGVVSFSARGYDPHTLASLLASVAGVESRAGLHCAPQVHERLGTAGAGGLVRFSPGQSTSDEQLDQAIDAVDRLVGMAPS